MPQSTPPVKHYVHELWAGAPKPHQVPKAFRLRTRVAMYEAHQRARELTRSMDQLPTLPPLPPPAPPAAPVHSVAPRKRQRRRKGRCGACGCKADTYTLRCAPCRERHRQRRRHGKPYLEGALLPIHPCPLGAYAVGSVAAA